jgi:acyl-CoA thioesterase-1
MKGCSLSEVKLTAGYVGAALALQCAACSQQAPAPAKSEVRAEQAASKPAPQADQKLVLAFGDSLYAGYRLGSQQGFAPALQRELAEAGVAAKVVNAGVSGDTTAGGRARLAFTLDGLERKPDLAIVGLGANDMLRGIDPAQTRANLDAILAELKTRGIPIVLTGMLAPRNYDHPYIRAFESIYPDLAKRYDAPLDAFFLQGVITNPKLLLDDGMHPNAAGVQVMAERVAPIVAKSLGKGGSAQGSQSS